LLSIIRTSKITKAIEFMFLSGISKVNYKDWTIIASTEPLTLSIEKNEEGYLIQNDKPVTINLPYKKGNERAKLKLYEKGKLIKTRDVVLNRSNPEQQYFKLNKAYNKVLIKL